MNYCFSFCFPLLASSWVFTSASRYSFSDISCLRLDSRSFLVVIVFFLIFFFVMLMLSVIMDGSSCYGGWRWRRRRWGWTSGSNFATDRVTDRTSRRRTPGRGSRGSPTVVHGIGYMIWWCVSKTHLKMSTAIVVIHGRVITCKVRNDRVLVFGKGFPHFRHDISSQINWEVRDFPVSMVMMMFHVQDSIDSKVDTPVSDSILGTQNHIHGRPVMSGSRDTCGRTWKPLLESLRSPLVKLHLIDGPNGSFDILDSHETLVETQVVSNSVFPCRCVSSEVAKGSREPIVDFIQSQLSFGSLNYRLCCLVFVVERKKDKK